MLVHDAEKDNKIQARCRRTRNKKGSNPGTMPENLKKKEGIESRHNAREPETKQRDRIRAQCQRTRNKRKGSNLGAMLENPKQNEGIESEHNAREPE